MIYTQKNPSELHEFLVSDLLDWFINVKGFTIKGVDLNGYIKPNTVKNTGKIGDGADKMPDIEAEDVINGVVVRGEAKIGSDLDSLHTQTQFALFSNMTRDNKYSLFFIIVPLGEFLRLTQILTELGLADRANVIPVKSGKI